MTLLNMLPTILSTIVLLFFCNSIYCQNVNDKDWDKEVVTEGFVEDGQQVLLDIPVLFPYAPLPTDFIPNSELRRVGIGTKRPRAKLHILLSSGEQELGINPVIISSGGNSMAITGNSINLRTLSPLYLNSVSQKKVVVPTLQITGGSDLAEPFEISSDLEIESGMVVVIDSENPGSLRLTNQAYDRAVPGIISGANELKPGLTMQRDRLENAHLVALSGRVYCIPTITHYR